MPNPPAIPADAGVWSLAPDMRRSLVLSACGDLTLYFRRANLALHAAALSRDDFWPEVGLLDRLVYKNKSQHRGSPFLGHMQEVRRLLQLLKSLSLAGLVRDMHRLLQQDDAVGGGDGADGNRPAKRQKSKADGGRTATPPSVRQVYRLPSREACVLVMQQLLMGCDLLSGLPRPVAAAARHLAGQLALSYFMPFCLTALAVVARIQVLSSQLLLDCVKAYNALAALLPLLPSAGDRPRGAVMTPHHSAPTAALAAVLPHALRCNGPHAKVSSMHVAVKSTVGGTAVNRLGEGGLPAQASTLAACAFGKNAVVAAPCLVAECSVEEAGRLYRSSAVTSCSTDSRSWEQQCQELWDRYGLMQSVPFAGVPAGGPGATSHIPVTVTQAGGVGLAQPAAATTAAAVGALQQHERTATRVSVAPSVAADAGVLVSRSSFFELMGQRGNVGAATVARAPAAGGTAAPRGRQQQTLQPTVFEDRGAAGGRTGGQGQAARAGALTASVEGGTVLPAVAASAAAPLARRQRLRPMSEAGAAAANAGDGRATIVQASELADAFDVPMYCLAGFTLGVSSTGGVANGTNSEVAVGRPEDEMAPVVPPDLSTTPGFLVGLSAMLGEPAAAKDGGGGSNVPVATHGAPVQVSDGVSASAGANSTSVGLADNEFVAPPVAATAAPPSAAVMQSASSTLPPATAFGFSAAAATATTAAAAATPGAAQSLPMPTASARPANAEHELEMLALAAHVAVASASDLAPVGLAQPTSPTALGSAAATRLGTSDVPQPATSLAEARTKAPPSAISPVQAHVAAPPAAPMDGAARLQPPLRLQALPAPRSSGAKRQRGDGSAPPQQAATQPGARGVGMLDVIAGGKQVTSASWLDLLGAAPAAPAPVNAAHDRSGKRKRKGAAAGGSGSKPCVPAGSGVDAASAADDIFGLLLGSQ